MFLSAIYNYLVTGSIARAGNWLAMLSAWVNSELHHLHFMQKLFNFGAGDPRVRLLILMIAGAWQAEAEKDELRTLQGKTGRQR